MAITSVVQRTNSRRQFQDVFNNVIELEAVWDPASVGSNGELHEEVAVTGARLGDIALISFDLDVADLDIVAHVTASDVVTVGLHNPGAGAVDLGSGNIHIVVLQLSHLHGD